MSKQETSEYILFIRSSVWHKGLSPEEIQGVITKVYAWYDRLIEEGRATGGKPLMFEGSVVSQKKGKIAADGPFAESKEAVAGYFMLDVGSLEEAVEIAKDYPALEYGATVEVRPVAPQCAVQLGLLEAEEIKKAAQSGGSRKG